MCSIRTENGSPDDLEANGDLVAGRAVDALTGEVENVSDENPEGDHDLVA